MQYFVGYQVQKENLYISKALIYICFLWREAIKGVYLAIQLPKS